MSKDTEFCVKRTYATVTEQKWQGTKINNKKYTHSIAIALTNRG